MEYALHRFPVLGQNASGELILAGAAIQTVLDRCHLEPPITAGEKIHAREDEE